MSERRIIWWVYRTALFSFFGWSVGVAVVSRPWLILGAAIGCCVLVAVGVLVVLVVSRGAAKPT